MHKISVFRGKPITTLYFNNHADSMEQIDHNEPEVKNRHWNIKIGAIVLDVGACFGAYTLTALSEGAAKVISWEPCMPNFLLKNLEANNWQNRCTIVNEALWSKKGFIQTGLSKTVIPQYKETISSSDCKCNSELGNIQSNCFIKCDVLDNSLAMYEPYIDIIKIDVEGAELEVLKGGKLLLQKFKPDVLIENHIFLDPSIYEKCKQFMISLGYREIRTEPYHAVSHSFYSMTNNQ